MMRLVLLLVLTLAGFGARAAAPSEITASYRVLKDGTPVGTVNEHFERHGKHYAIESITTANGIFALFAKGSIILRSTGEITPAGLRPLHFEHHRGSDPARLVVADFDWKTMTVTHTYDGKSETAQLAPRTQDRISQLYQFMFQPPHAPEVEVRMSTGRQLNIYRYLVVGEETQDTPQGALQTVHLSRQRTPDENGTELWLAKTRHFFPIRIVIEEKDGGKLEQQLESLSFKPGR